MSMRNVWDEPARRIGLDDLAVEDEVGGAGVAHLRRAVVEVAAARAQVELAAPAVAVARRPVRVGDRRPDRLRRRVDVDPVHLRRHGGFGHRGHPVFSSSFLRSASAETWRSVYLSIQRSWMSPLGLELGQRAAVTHEEPVQEEATRGVGERLEHEVVVGHAVRRAGRDLRLVLQGQLRRGLLRRQLARPCARPRRAALQAMASALRPGGWTSRPAARTDASRAGDPLSRRAVCGPPRAAPAPRRAARAGGV